MKKWWIRACVRASERTTRTGNSAVAFMISIFGSTGKRLTGGLRTVFVSCGEGGGGGGDGGGDGERDGEDTKKCATSGLDMRRVDDNV